MSDFGISKFLGNEDSMTQTMTLATIGYMAPGNISSLQFNLMFTNTHTQTQICLKKVLSILLFTIK